MQLTSKISLLIILRSKNWRDTVVISHERSERTNETPIRLSTAWRYNRPISRSGKNYFWRSLHDAPAHLLRLMLGVNNPVTNSVGTRASCNRDIIDLTLRSARSLGSFARSPLNITIRNNRRGSLISVCDYIYDFLHNHFCRRNCIVSNLDCSTHVRVARKIVSPNGNLNVE